MADIKKANRLNIYQKNRSHELNDNMNCDHLKQLSTMQIEHHSSFHEFKMRCYFNIQHEMLFHEFNMRGILFVKFGIIAQKNKLYLIT